MNPAQRWHSWPALVVILGLLAVAALTACGAASPAREQSSGARSGVTGASQAASGAAPAASAAPAARANPAAPAADVPLPDQPRKVVKTGTLSLVVKDVDSAVAQIRGIALRYGGDLAQYANSKVGDARIGDVVIQVEAARFEDAMRELRTFDGVIDRTVDRAEAKDVTEEYVDVTAQIRNLQATADQLRALLPKATTTSDTLAIQREVNAVQSQIDRLQARANYLESRAALSTITLHLETPATVAALDPGWRFTAVVERAWAASLRALQGVATVAITLLVFSWWLLPIAALAALALRFYRRRRAAPATPPAPPTPPVAPPASPAPTTGD